MLKRNRQNIIKEILMNEGTVLISDLCNKLDCSSETIRRDLVELEELGFAKKIYGGAYLPDKFDKSVPVTLRNTFFNEEKSKIAQQSIELINEGDTIFLDSSSTCKKLAEFIIREKKAITIITNSIDIINCYQKNEDERIIGLGGYLNLTNRAFQGEQTTSAIKNYVVNKAFISCPSIEFEFGLTDNSIEAAAIRREMINQSREAFLIADHTKFSSHSPFVISDFSKIKTIITDRKLSKEWEQYSSSKKISLCYSDKIQSKKEQKE